MKKRMEIEAALRWAYRDELPKARQWNDSRFLALARPGLQSKAMSIC